MIINETAITGSEEIEGKASLPEKALIDFYQAFNNSDMDLMASNWEHTDEVSMSNPLGGVKRGWDSIERVYQKIFNGSAKVYVEFYDYTIHRSGVMFIAVGRERGYFQQADKKIDLAIRTSRTYRLDCGRWHQIHHHGSIEDPSLLEKYQRAVLSQ